MSAAMSHRGAVHTREQFEFIADAPLDVAWPLFGADAERAWAPDWDPAFIWPQRQPMKRAWYSRWSRETARQCGSIPALTG